MTPLEKGTAPLGRRAEADTKNQPPEAYPSPGHEPSDVDEVLARVRRYESAARSIAENENFTTKARCRALLELSQRGRHEELPGFIEAGIWRGCRHFFESDQRVPTNVIEANRRLLHRGYVDCPSCRRPLPSSADLDRWRELGHDLRRPA